jgi:FkbM family methyltransferase
MRWAFINFEIDFKRTVYGFRSNRESLSDTNMVHGFLRSSLKRIHPSARSDIARVVRLMAAGTLSRRVLNQVYSRLSLGQKEYWHTQYAKVFRNQAQKTRPGHWLLDFAGQPVTLPVGGPEMWLEWDAALSLLGHEPEIKRAYAALIESSLRPRLFLDVGANYGLHSLLFLVHGIPAISFEPNVRCHEYFQRVTEMNGVGKDLQALALGEREGVVELWSPKSETWYGTTVKSARDRIPTVEALETVVVRQTTLDSFVKEHDLRPELIKIDTEGAESDVIRGAAHTLNTLRPIVIFESWPDADRSELFALFQLARLSISTLRANDSPPRMIRDVCDFEQLSSTNFVAVPNESAKLLASIL